MDNKFHTNSQELPGPPLYAWTNLESLTIRKTENDINWNGETVWDLDKILNGPKKIKVFVECQSGSAERDIIGLVKFHTKNDLAYFRYHTYNQQAWSFNSENIILRMDSSCKVTITTTTNKPSGNFILNIQLLGYKS